MILSIAILVLSTALFLFYLQTLCEKVLRREFSRPYFQDVLNAIDLEFPRLRQALSANAPMSYSQIQLALKCDFFTLRYLVKNGDPKRRRFSWQERLLVSYFSVLLLILPLSYAFHFRERQSVMKLTVILYHFANLVGERVTPVNASNMVPSRQS
jgi:hypothetical protein